MDFFNSKSVWTYLFIFIGKIAEVSLSTLRIMLINRGERAKGVIVAIFEYTLWLFITGTVLSSFKDDILKIVVLIAAFAAGNFVGSWLEGKLALGVCTISVYFKSIDDARALAKKLREEGHAVTLMDAEGISEKRREIITLTVKRKFTDEIIRTINNFDPTAMVTIANTTSVKGGFLKDTVKRSVGLPQYIFKKRIFSEPKADEKTDKK